MAHGSNIFGSGDVKVEHPDHKHFWSVFFPKQIRADGRFLLYSDTVEDEQTSYVSLGSENQTGEWEAHMRWRVERLMLRNLCF